jgi:PAS domain S-box-containing protein
MDASNAPQGEAKAGIPDSELLKLIFESATDFGIFTMDPNGITTSWNSGAKRLFGFEDSEIIGRTADVVFPPEEGGSEAAAEERRLARAHGRAEDERWQMRKDGTRFWASGLLMPLANPSSGFVKIVRDRTEQHAAEQQLHETEELFRVLATNIPQLVFRGKTDGARTWGSPQWSVFTGLVFEDSLEFRWLDAVHPDDRDRTRQAWAEAATSGQYYCEHRFRRASDGEYRWHQTRAVSRGGPATPETEWVGTSTDIHTLRTLQDRQKVILAELQHRTRNLLAVVQSIARQTVRSSASLGEFKEEYERRLRALGRVQGLLARNDHHSIDLRELIDMELHAHGVDEASGRISVQGPPVVLSASAAQVLALAFHELATNAVKYGALRQPAGKLAVTWQADDARDQQMARIEWRESEIEIPEGPKRKGYGSELIERALPYQLGAKTRLEFGREGVRCEIVIPTKRNGRSDG